MIWTVETYWAPGTVPSTEHADGRQDAVTRALARHAAGAWHVAAQVNGRAVFAWHRR